uniref:Uncharacterized protein n=1 Tax=Anguilla anguilla TaxID=7936 RepID=A0A0E9Q5B8_ANGAN
MFYFCFHDFPPFQHFLPAGLVGLSDGSPPPHV